MLQKAVLKFYSIFVNILEEKSYYQVIIKLIKYNFSIFVQIFYLIYFKITIITIV